VFKWPSLVDFNVMQHSDNPSLQIPRAQSNNIFAYVGLYISSSKSISRSSSFSNDVCSPTISYQQVSGVNPQYIMACLKCDYDILYCDFDSYYFELPHPANAGYVPCKSC
jgi:hypothetical protein